MVEYALSAKPGWASLGARLMVGQRTLNPYVGVRILRPQPDDHKVLSGGSAEMVTPQRRVATPADWLFAPEWLIVEDARRLSGHDRGMML